MLRRLESEVSQRLARLAANARPSSGRSTRAAAAVRAAAMPRTYEVYVQSSA